MARQGDAIFVNRALFEQVVESLCLCDEPSDICLEHEERQQALLELYAADGLQHFDENRLIDLATSAAFYRVCEVVYRRRRQFDKIVSCFWRDPARRHLAFNYVQTVVADKTMSTDELQRLRTAVIESVTELVAIDAWRTGKLLLVTLGVSAEHVIQQLDTDESVYNFLSGVFDYIASSPEIQSSLEPSVYERHVEIMCRLHLPPSQIVSFLRATSGYHLTEMLDICQRHSVSDAVVCLLEKSGDIRGAFDILFERVTRVMSDATQNDSNDVDVKLKTLVKDVTELLQRGSRQMEQTELETVWFMLLDFLMDTMKLVKTKSAGDAGVNCTLGDGVKSVTRQVINAVMSHLPLPEVLQRIVANEGAGHFGDVRDLLTEVLDACSYEQTLLSTCARLLHGDLHCAWTSKTQWSRRATASHTDTCLVCGRVAVGPSVAASQRPDGLGLVCFHCGHVVHRSCLLDSVTSPTSRDESERRWQCPVCCRSRSATAPVPLPARSMSTTHCQLEQHQVDSVHKLRSVSRSPSRLTVLAELAQLEHTRASSAVGHPRFKGFVHSDILHKEQFALRLAAPPVPTD